jgi:uncharacterized YkwD family protein
MHFFPNLVFFTKTKRLEKGWILKKSIFLFIKVSLLFEWKILHLILQKSCAMMNLFKKETTKGEEINMFKKIGTAAVLSAALFVGGTFSASADAQQSNVKTDVQYKVHYSVNGEQGSLEGEEAQTLIKQLMHKFNNLGKMDWMNVQTEEKESKEKQEEPNQDQSKEETAAKKDNKDVEQPKEEQPAKEEKTEEPKQEESAEKEEQPVQEEPAKEAGTEEEQPKEERPVEEQPQEEVKQPEAPAPTQPAQPQEQQQEQVQSEQLNAFEQEVVELTNAERAKQGLAPLEIDEELSQVAREKSNDMASNNYFSHNSPVYGSPFDMMNQFGISYRTAGENIAQGQTSPEQVVNAWMNSDGHRANILNGDFTHIGVGFVENGNHWTQMFIGK